MRPIFVDVETDKSGHLYLVAVLDDGQLTQYVTDPRLTAAAEWSSLPCRSPAEICRQLAERATAEGRTLVGFSRHDLEVIRRCGDIDVSRYVDANKVVGRWLWRNHPDRPASRCDNTLLDSYRALTGRRPPQGYGKGVTTRRLNAVIEGLQKRGAYEALTPVVKGKWTKVLGHNRFDVDALEEMFDVMRSRNPAALEYAEARSVVS